MRPILISPSLMCADPLALGQILPALESGGADLLHIDIMDGAYVPNYGLGSDAIQALRKATSIPLDIHLMVTHPDRKLPVVPLMAGDTVTLHVEAALHPHRLVAQLLAQGMRPMMALNPGTPISLVEELLPELFGVLVMTVDPGFAGQRLIPHTLDKLARLRDLAEHMGREDLILGVDGNTSLENLPRMRAAGADLFIGGTAGLFRQELPLEQSLVRFRQAIQNATPAKEAP